MADIDKSLPNVKETITIPSDEAIQEEQAQEQAEIAEAGDPVEITENEDGSVDLDFDPALAAVEGAQEHYANLADFLPDEILNMVANEISGNYQDYISSGIRLAWV